MIQKQRNLKGSLEIKQKDKKSYNKIKSQTLNTQTLDTTTPKQTDIRHDKT